MDLSNYKFIKGTPSMVLMPARDYVFRVSNEHHIIRIPRRGKYFDIDPEFFKEEDGEFNVFDEGSNIFYTPTIIKILLATKQYPELDFNQFFVPYLRGTIMKCPNCSCDNIEPFFIEEMPCSHCKELNTIEYYICPNCDGAVSTAWKVIDNKVLDKVTISEENFDLVGESIFNADVSKKKSSSMCDMFHKCIKCGAIAYESEPGFYSCSVCNFEWETF
jgi:hypothetical protein